MTERGVTWLRTHRVAVSLFLLGLMLLYTLLRGVYRPENRDDAFSLSFLYNFLNRGIEDDLSFGNAFRGSGQNGVALFGKIQAFIYGPILNIVGWSRDAAHLISTVVMALTAIAWGAAIGRATGRTSVAAISAGLLLLVEPGFAAANQARPDALTLLFVALSILSLAYRRWVLAGVLALAAVEIHPMGVAALLHVIAWHGIAMVRARERRKEIALAAMKSAFGMGLGAIAYALLHWQRLPELPAVLFSNSGGSVGGFAFSYFFETQYLRHLPELVIFVGAAALAIRLRLLQNERLFAVMVVASVALLLLIRRENFHYMLFVYPVLIYLLVLVADRLRRVALPLLVFVALLTPQYAFAYIQNRDYDLNTYLSAIAVAVPDDALPVIGPPNAWFAMYEREFYSLQSGSHALIARDLQAFYIISNPYPDAENDRRVARELVSGYSCVQLSTTPVFETSMTVERCVHSGAAKPQEPLTPIGSRDGAHVLPS